MGRLFRSAGCLFNSAKTLASSASILSIQTRAFRLSDEFEHEGKLVRVLLSKEIEESETVGAILQEELIRPNKNSLFVWTMPTNFLNSDYSNGVYPGHNLSSVTDEYGAVVCSMSKRPDTKMLLGERRRIPDARFKSQSMTTRLFSPRFTSVEEEIEIWLKRATAVPGYPLFIHVLPLTSQLELSSEVYKNHVEYMQLLGEAYSLFSFRHPLSDQYIRAGNCNSATEQSIFGLNLSSVADLSCQEAAINMILRLVKKEYHLDYLEMVNTLGLTEGIETSTIAEDLYRSSFTC